MFFFQATVNPQAEAETPPQEPEVPEVPVEQSNEPSEPTEPSGEKPGRLATFYNLVKTPFQLSLSGMATRL